MKSTSFLAAALLLSYLGIHFGTKHAPAWQVTLLVSLVHFMLLRLSHGRGSFRTHLSWSTVIASWGGICLLALFWLHAPLRFELWSDAWLAAIRTTDPTPHEWLNHSSRSASATTGNWLWNENSIRPLPRRAQLKPGNQPEVFVQLDYPEDAAMLLKNRAYLSAFSLGRYHHASWAITTSCPPFPERQLTPRRPVISYEVFHPSSPAGHAPLISLQGLCDSTIKTIRRGDGVRLLPAQSSPLGYRYRATSQTIEIDDLPQDSHSSNHSFLDPDYLTLPSDPAFLDSLQNLILSRCSAGPLPQRLQSLCRILREECEYSLLIENPLNRDPLNNFLFHEKKGHCEMFATAAAMAARAMGIPSRITYGWAGGSYFENSRLFVFRAREAHAWTEVWIDDLGWVILDATPPLAIGRSRAAPAEEKPLTNAELASPQDLDYATSSAPTWISWLLTAIALAGGTSTWWRNKRPLTSDLSAHWNGKKSHHAYEAQLHAWCRAEGIQPAPHWSLGEIIDALSQPPHCSAELRRYHYATRYGTMPHDPATERRFAHTLQQEARSRLESQKSKKPLDHPSSGP